jgi:hypothetical protein
MHLLVPAFPAHRSAELKARNYVNTDPVVPTTTVPLSIAWRVASGERSALEPAMRHYDRSLYRLARATLRDDAEPKEPSQDAYFCVYPCIGRFLEPPRFLIRRRRVIVNL